MGLAQPVESVEQAVMVLGRAELYRWLSVLLTASGSGRKASRALREVALARARLLELLAPAAAAPPAALFTVGLLSMLDALLRVPLAEALAPLQIAEPAREAIVAAPGRGGRCCSSRLPWNATTRRGRAARRRARRAGCGAGAGGSGLGLVGGTLARPGGRRMTDHAARERVALWAALALILCWGANFSVQKAVFAALTPGGFLFVRYLIMPLAAALLLFAHFGTRWPRLCAASCGSSSLGVTGHLLHVGLVTYGIHWSTAFSSSLILAIGPVFTLLILRWHGSEHLTRGQVAGVALAVCGVLVFLSDKLMVAQWQAGGGDSRCSSPRPSSRSTPSTPSR